METETQASEEGLDAAGLSGYVLVATNRVWVAKLQDAVTQATPALAWKPCQECIQEMDAELAEGKQG